MRRARLVVAAALVVIACAVFAAPASADDTGWTIQRFAADIKIQSDGRVLVQEAIDVDFDGLQRHGIFRDIPVVYDWPAKPRTVRVYQLQVLWVQDDAGRAITYETSRQGAMEEIKIGDANRVVSGVQRYRLAYLLNGALNGFSDHDELYWNVTGSQWSVPIASASAVVSGPSAFSQTTCFVGYAGATDTCDRQGSGSRITFSAGRALEPGQQLTVVVGLPKGVVPQPAPILEDKPRDAAGYFDLTPAWLALAVFAAVLGIALVVWRWWSVGRDQPERTTIVPEYEPPEKMRPAEAGVLLDERADTLDVTATIVDLAVRGYLTITEIPKHGLFGSRDWLLKRAKPDDADLLEYERTIQGGLFDDGDEVKLSALRRHFYTTLAKAEKQLYGEVTQKGWFPADPSHVRATYAVVGVAVILIAAGLAALFGYLFGGGIVGVGAGIGGLALLAASPVMPRKSRDGAELARRALGFRRYMEVAETDRQRFAEKEHIFADYLPYAIVFKCVDQWAKAFQGIDLRAATQGWYTGTYVGAFNAMDFSSDLSSFSNQISTAIASTPGGSGGSGFGGGAGGGGGGGGGGSW
ncbi:MAG TPA: DUF2207 domain-containing protein [Candidatus Limnocylindria bacterium]